MMISVIMSVYATNLKHFKNSIESILLQTVKDFELIIVLDGDNSYIEYLESLNDSRIKILCNKTNKGLAFSLNKAITHAKGNYIFRMDADDISIHDRFERQIKYLEDGVPIISSGCILIDKEDKEIGRSKSFHLFHNFIRRIQLYCLKLNPVIHPSVAAHRMVFEKYKYNESYNYSQDFELWLRMRKEYKIYFDSTRLIKYRLNDVNTKAIQKEYYYKLAKSIYKKKL